MHCSCLFFRIDRIYHFRHSFKLINPFIIIFLIIISLLLTSCGQSEKKHPVAVKPKDTTKALAEKKEEDRIQKRKEIEEHERIDSIYNGEILTEALKIAEKNRTNNTFNKYFVATMPDSSYQIQVDISSDFYFTQKFPHLIIRRENPSSIYIDVFLNTGNKFKKILSHEIWTMEYTGDTIRDVNGDGLKDFVVNWYGSTGCCLKAFSNVYLIRTNQKSFSKSFQFINPTFSPNEHMIRGVCYGHPGETEIYKYRWNHESIDTLEYIYYEKNDKGEKTGKVVVSNNRPYSENHKILSRLSAVPHEYRGIDGFEWFTGDLK